MNGVAGTTMAGPRADRTFAAVLLALTPAGDHGSVEQLDERLRRRVEALCDVGVEVGIFGVSTDALDLGWAPGGPGRLHVIRDDAAYRVAADGVHLVWRSGDESTDASASRGVEMLGDRRDRLAAVRWLLAAWRDRGIGAGLVLLLGGQLTALRHTAPGVTLVGLDHPGISDAAVLEILDAQLGRHRDGRVPDVDADPAWAVPLPYPDRPADALVQGALACLGDGRFGSRGALEEDAAHEWAQVLAAGVYEDDGVHRALLGGPGWTALEPPAPRGGHRLLDLRTGVLWREAESGYRSLRFASAERSGTMALRAEAPHDGIEVGPALRPSVATTPGVWTSSVRSVRGGGLSAAARQRFRRGPVVTVERLACYVADPRRCPPPATARRNLDAAWDRGFAALLSEHRAAWAQRWADAVVSIEGDPGAELAVRFALFQLLSSVAGEGEAAVGARGLTGPAYAGHVFWDADVFVLPVLAAVRPEAARAMLQYRVARIDAAERRARSKGFDGLLWPWESADDGEDVTPGTARDRDGRLFPIRTSEAEHHIVADVAWAAAHYARWTGDEGFLDGPGLPLLLDGARFWASRVETASDGRGHVRRVIGPDEYHELVDDNAYTNVMARWHLREAAALAERLGAAGDEAARWRHVADTLVDGYDPATGVYEQFAGFHRLTPLLITDVAQPPVAADLLLGREAVASSQVVKQADVLMLHHLVPDDVAADSLRPNLDHYAPRTAHGSSLSPAIHAAAWARAREPDRALDALRPALRLDLDDVTGLTAGGLHLATMGGVWQAVAFGFLGLRAKGVALGVDPVLPATWNAVEMVLRFRAARVVVRATHHRLEIRCDRPLPVALGRDGHTVAVAPPGATFDLDGAS